jgi:hypothetical protein
MPRIAGRRRMYKKGERKYTTQKKKVERKPSYFFSEKASSYLKYIRVVRKYIQKKHGLSISELELILYLYDETIFDKQTFDSYACILGFTSFDWFSKLKDREIIKKWRDEPGYKRLYTLTHKYKLVCNSLYKHLEGEPIPMHVNQNPLFKSNASFSDKMYARLIRQMNKKREEGNSNPDLS